MTTVKGIALAPGVSRNGRLYTKEAIARAYARLSERVQSGAFPVVMRTHHDAGDDSTRVVGRVRSVSLTSDGAIAYESQLADTTAGRDIAALADGNDRALAHVSIYGSWVGTPRRVEHDGRTVETGDDLEIDKIDFTATPGVLGASARVETFTPSADPAVLAESVRPVMFADDVTTSEALADATTCASVSGCVNGIDVSLCAWSIPATELDAYTDTMQRALTAALTCLDAGLVDDDTDASTETTQTPATTPEAATQKEAVMADASTQGEQVAEAAATETQPTISDVLAAVKDLTAALKPRTEADAPAETVIWDPDKVADLTESIRAQVVADLVKEGIVKPTRKGAGLTETTSTDVDPAEAWEQRGEAFAAALGFPTAD